MSGGFCEIHVGEFMSSGNSCQVHVESGLYQSGVQRALNLSSLFYGKRSLGVFGFSTTAS